MKAYRIYRHVTGGTEAVKQGWSWPAFLFTFFWAMVKKMWGLGLGVLVGWLAVAVVLGMAGDSRAIDAFGNLVGLIVSVVFGVNGNAWRASNLRSRGYEAVGTVAAKNPEEAIALSLKPGEPGAKPSLEQAA